MRILHGFDCRNQVAVGRFRNAVNDSGYAQLASLIPREEVKTCGVLYVTEGRLSNTILGHRGEQIASALSARITIASLVQLSQRICDTH